MSNSLHDSVHELLLASLRMWHSNAEISVTGDNTFLLITGEQTISIKPAPVELPFRWVIKTTERTRTAASVSGLLRVLRQALDADYQPLRLTIAPLPPPNQ